MYIYKTSLYHNETNVVGIPPNNTANVADFEGATKKPDALEVSSISIADTSFEFDKTYEDFDTLIDGANYNWSDVRYEDNGKRYTLYLITSNPA